MCFVSKGQKKIGTIGLTILRFKVLWWAHPDFQQPFSSFYKRRNALGFKEENQGFLRNPCSFSFPPSPFLLLVREETPLGLKKRNNQLRSNWLRQFAIGKLPFSFLCDGKNALHFFLASYGIALQFRRFRQSFFFSLLEKRKRLF